MSKKIFCLLIDFKYLDHFLHTQECLMEKISKNYERFYLINSSQIENKINSIYFNWDKFSNAKFEEKQVNKSIFKNFILLNPSNIEELNEFFRNKEVLIINQIERSFSYFKLWFYLNKKNISNIIISNSAVQETSEQVATTLNLKIKSFIAKKLPKKIFTLLSIVNIFPNIKLRFEANKNFYNFFSKKTLRNKFIKPIYEKIISINHRTYDMNIINKLDVSEKYIVFIEADLNHKEDVARRGYLGDEIINNHYKKMREHLNHLSQIFQKEVVVCVHPKYDLELVQSKFKGFKVLKYRTREFIYKSFLVVFLESSSIIDAFFLKKNIIQIKPSFDWTAGIDYVSKFGITNLDIQKQEERFIEKNKLKKMLEDKEIGYENFINSYIKHNDDDEPGVDKVIRVLKENFF
tara:strand:+ start:167 stop:1384 length:1218 start_codon:yes stop_codon:yes gene_type:complete